MGNKSRFYTVFDNQILSKRDGGIIWETKSAGYNATVWQQGENGRPDYPVFIKDGIDTYEKAVKWCKKMEDK